MNAGFLGSFSKMMGDKKVFIDPYVQVTFAGQQVLPLWFTFSLFIQYRYSQMKLELNMLVVLVKCTKTKWSDTDCSVF